MHFPIWFRLFLATVAPLLLAQNPPEPKPEAAQSPSSPPTEAPSAPQAAPVPAQAPAAIKDSRTEARREYLEGLSTQQRQKVTGALMHVWEDAEVARSREELRQAYEAYKKQIRAALKDVDPEVQSIIAPIFEKSFKEAPMAVEWADPSVPGRRLARALGLGEFDRLTEDERCLLTSLWERVQADPRYIAAEKLVNRATDATARNSALNQLRKDTRHIAVELESEIGLLWEKYPEAAAK